MNQETPGRRKKILFLITKATWGGAQRYVYDLATSLPKDTFEPTVAYGESGKLTAMLDAKNIRTRRVPTLGRDIAFISDIASFFQILTVILQERPDVVHLNSSKAAALGAFAARLARVPKIVFTVHGWPFKEDRGFIARKLIYFISWFTGFLSHSIIVVSKEDEVLGKRMRFVRKNIHYIPLGLTRMYSIKDAETIFGPANPFRDSVRLVTIAELTPNKGLLYGIKMIEELANRTPHKYTYSIIGEGEQATFLRDMAEKLHVADSVSFISFVPNPPADLQTEAAKYLPAFDIFILPSIKEGMPYVLLEAATAGLPIIASNVVETEASSLPNIYFVSPADGHALAKEVERLVDNLPSRKPGMIGSFANMLEKTVELY